MNAIEIDGLWKKFRRRKEWVNNLKQAVVFFLKRRSAYDEFWALRDISLQVPVGQSLGLIGPNGSGKTTLLSLIARILRPTQGTVSAQGRVVTLMELGSGFHPELSGRDNVYLNGALLGLSSREIGKRYRDIVEFAELSGFMGTDLGNFSAGMITRLGFAVASNVDPDILLIDEVLAVGDQQFRQKCFARIRELILEGKTVLFVSHSLHLVRRICSRTIWLEQGKIVRDGDTEAVIKAYQEGSHG